MLLPIGPGQPSRSPLIKHIVLFRTVRVAIAGLTVAIFCLYVRTVADVWRAERLQDQNNQQSLETSARLGPWNADTLWLLGRYFLHGRQDSGRAVSLLNRAVELNPYSARYWLDLAEAQMTRGETGEVQRSLARALEAEPTSPAIAWRSANYYLAGNDLDSALPLFRVAMQYDPSYIPAALDLSWRATGSVGQISAKALPPHPAPYFALLKILIDQDQSAPANDLWRNLTARKLQFPIPQAFPYFDYLIRTHQVEQAKAVWAELMKVSVTPPNLLHNGSFEADFLNGGFDWRYMRCDQVDVAFDTREVHGGARSLRFEFAGPPVADAGVYQYVPVQPNTAYRLTAFVKAEEINTASGPRLAVEDSSAAQLLGTTDEFRDSSAWRQRALEFSTGPDTRLVAVRVVRRPGNLLIQGTLWLDDVELLPRAAGSDMNP